MSLVISGNYHSTTITNLLVSYRKFNTKKISRVIEYNKSLEILRQELCQGKTNCKLTDKQGNVKTGRDEIMKIVELFQSETYKRDNEYNSNPVSEGILNITIREKERFLI